MTLKYALDIAPVVYRDLSQIEEYISLDKPGAAKKVIKGITMRIRSLPDNPFIGVSLRKKFDVDTDLFGLIVKPHIVIYNVKDVQIKVYRVLDCRSDYLASLGFNAVIYDSGY